MEIFDIRTRDGRRTGLRKEREAVHRDGDWHGTAHIWLVRRREGHMQVLLQKRSRSKETFPGCFDASCAGHLSAGDAFLDGALRELSEELGLKARPEELFTPEEAAGRSAAGKRTGLFLLCPAMGDPRTAEVRELLAAFPGKTPVYFRFRDSGKLLLAPKNLWTDISEPVLRRLRAVLGEDCVVYRP